MQRVAERTPDVIVLDVALPDVDGVTLCRRLRALPATAEVPIVLLTGDSTTTDADGRAAGANAFVRKPFSPLELLETIEQLAGGLPQGPFRLMTDERPEEQLLLYAQDLRRLLELERSQRLLIQSAYEETVTALARALESKDIGTGAHSNRVTKYAVQLAQTIDPALLDDQSIEYGFLLHDVGKIAIPDTVLMKPGPLDDAERRVMETHTILGEQILDRVPLLQGEGLKIIRSHHERWDGTGYPDQLAGRGDPQICAHLLRRRRARRDDDRPPVPEGAHVERGRAGDRRGGGSSVRPDRRRRVPELRAAAAAHLLRAGGCVARSAGCARCGRTSRGSAFASFGSVVYVRMTAAPFLTSAYCVIAVSRRLPPTLKRARYVRRTALPAGSVTIRHQIGWTTKSTFASCFNASWRHAASGSAVRSVTTLRFVANPVESDDGARSNAIIFTARFVFPHSEEVVHERRELRLVAREAPHLAEQARAVPALVGPARGQLEREALALMAHPAGSGLGSGRERDGGGDGDREEKAAHVVSIDRVRRLR